MMNQNNQRKTELLAPAGSFETLKAVVNAGADAVYCAGNRFGARAYANNFTEEEMISAIDFMHLKGKKLYMTVNTLLKEAELEELYDYLVPYYETGLDAVIVQDLWCRFIVKGGMQSYCNSQRAFFRGNRQYISADRSRN